jgi:hypothetical protein
MRYVLHIPSWTAPGGKIIRQQYGRSAISDAFQEWEESVERIAGPIHHGQS